MNGATNRLFLVQERAKAAVLSQLHRRGLDITRASFDLQLRAILATQSIDAVLDVGANIGQYAAGLRKGGYAGRIISCEPQSGAFAELTKRAAGDPKWVALQTGVGAEDSILSINVSANSYSSSFLPVSERHLDVAPASRVIATEEVAVTTVDHLVEAHSLDPATTMLKVDTQGYEHLVLDGARATLPAFCVVQLEMSMVELYHGQQLFPQLLERMSVAGLTLYAIDPAYADPDTGQMLWADGVFVRPRSA